MRVEELMSVVKWCKQGDSVRDCARLMKEESLGFVPICDDAGTPFGVVTDRDLAIRVLAEGRSADDPIERFMTHDTIACRLGDDLRDAERLMRERRTSRVMVCDEDGKVRGVISLADIAGVAEDEEIGETVQQVKSDQPAAH
jgi:signal-transduction protein with cAMP-binding, CBS, and nucleotidyltransferase domain